MNGPAGGVLDWNAVDWWKTEGDVRRLRQRIFKASAEGDLKKVRNLQKLMLRSYANTLVSVRRVTQLNAGRATAGVDGEVVMTAPGKAWLVTDVHRGRDLVARPVKRVHIPKANGKRRPLGIPVLRDRVQQARVVNALEPEWEARFEPKSYGFRPGRGCHDAIEAIYWSLKGASSKRQWILDADLSAAFDRIDHNYLLEQLGTFPAKGMIAVWVWAGVIENGRFAPTAEGTPQGGVASPLLLNVALHGMEEAAGVRYSRMGVSGAHTVAGSPALVRYADDFVVMCHSREQAEQVWRRLEQWLEPRGLRINMDKTQVVHVDQGFDFLGFTVRRYGRRKLLIKPSDAAMKRVRKRLTDEMRALRGANALAVIRRLNPIIRGWSAYYRSVVSKEIFGKVDDHLWKLTYRWALRAHPNKSKRWAIARHFDTFNQNRQDRWVSGDRDSGMYLRRFVWTKIVRHRLVSGTSSPDDPDLVGYWAARRRQRPLPVDAPTRRLIAAQNGRCPECGDFLLHVDEGPRSPQQWEQWIRTTRMALRRQALAHQIVPAPQSPNMETERLLHTHCLRKIAAVDQQAGRTQASSGLA